jgi:two-component system LytT family response regulator/two-component system response regulator LytT
MPPRATHLLSAIIADDEELARDELRFLLGEIGGIEVVGMAANGLEALSLIAELDPAIAFLDIQMPGLDGLGVVRRLKEAGTELPHIVFSTAWDQYAVEAFRLDAMDYILKPVDRKRLAETVDRAQRMASAAQAEPAVEVDDEPDPDKGRLPNFTRLLVRSGPRNLIVDQKDLVYATIEDGVITLVTSQIEGQSTYRTLEDLQAALDPDVFWRAHRSYVVNLNRVREITPWFKSTWQLKMDDKRNSEIPVSRTQSRRLREMLNL